jgi:hypothetical protein
MSPVASNWGEHESFVTTPNSKTRTKLGHVETALSTIKLLDSYN